LSQRKWKGPKRVKNAKPTTIPAAITPTPASFMRDPEFVAPIIVLAIVVLLIIAVRTVTVMALVTFLIRKLREEETGTRE
jgi:hypothetical protein